MREVRTEPKEEAYIEGLFSCIAPRYDFLNAVLSLTRHKAWRRRAVEMSGLESGGCALDVCCGTGDFAFDLAAKAGIRGRVVGIDFCLPMLAVAREKCKRLGGDQVEFLPGNACCLPFRDDSFDCVTVGFGLRNVADLRAAMSEMARVTRPGGKVISLEIVGMRSRLLRWPWMACFHGLAPIAARILGGDRSAYAYLSRSVRGFVSSEDLAGEFETCGLRDVRHYHLACGAVCIHVGEKSC